MDKVFACVSQLVPLFEAVVKEDWEGVQKARREISKLENEADELKKDLRLNLPNSMMLPVSRRDLLEVLTMQDKIANKAKDISGIILGRKMTLPKEVGDAYVEYVQRCVDATQQAQTTVNELDELVETGFRGSEVEIVEAMINKLNEVESDTDNIQVEIRATLFKIERDLPPIDVMFMYKVIDATGDVADLAQRVGSRLQLMLAR
jgi:predicted phosphate transport protein (TIGR00153 family)